MANVFVYVDRQGTWKVGKGGYPWPTLIGPFTSSLIAQKVKEEMERRYKGVPMPRPQGCFKKVKTDAETKYRANQSYLRSQVTRQVGGDFGDPVAYGGIWQRGDRLMIVENLADCGMDCDCWQTYYTDLSDIKYLDDWVKWDQVKSCCGAEEGWHSSLAKLEDAARYYGWHEVAGDRDHYYLRKDVLDRLGGFGVDVEGYRRSDDDLPSEETLRAWRYCDLDNVTGCKFAYLRRRGSHIDTTETHDAMSRYDAEAGVPTLVK